MPRTLTFAIWDLPPGDLLARNSLAVDAGLPVAVVRCRPSQGLKLVLDGSVDFALVPSLTTIEHSASLDVLPEVAVSSWKYPFARVQLPGGLQDRPLRLVVDPAFEQETFLTKVILREHYGAEPDTVPASPDSGAASVKEARLWVGGEVPGLELDGLVLDLGQEWYELANYPMVWGLFVAAKGKAEPTMLRILKQLAAASLADRAAFAAAAESRDPVREFYLDDLRLSLDDLAVAGLTELQDYAFYNDVIDEVAALPIVAFSDGEEEGGGAKGIGDAHTTDSADDVV